MGQFQIRFRQLRAGYKRRLGAYLPEARQARDEAVSDHKAVERATMRSRFRRPMVLSAVLLAIGVGSMAAARLSHRTYCRIEGRLPSTIAADPTAICRTFRDAVGRRSVSIVIRFHHPDSVSAQATATAGSARLAYPTVTISGSDRAIDMETISVLAKAVAKQIA